MGGDVDDGGDGVGAAAAVCGVAFGGGGGGVGAGDAVCDLCVCRRHHRAEAGGDDGGVGGGVGDVCSGAENCFCGVGRGIGGGAGGE
ncbi:MAG: hypothetical protein EBQ80_03875 [Proteobacteria bacterium]|nr:hypothetical protein [Pseudomonadota bacterium]